MPDVEAAWAAAFQAVAWGYSEIVRQRRMAAVRDVALAAYDAGALAERRYGRWRRPYMMDEKRARIQALAEGRKE